MKSSLYSYFLGHASKYSTKKQQKLGAFIRKIKAKKKRIRKIAYKSRRINRLRSV